MQLDRRAYRLCLWVEQTVHFACLTCFFATSFAATEEYTAAQNLSRIWLDGWPDDLKFMVPIVPKLEQVKNLFPDDLV